VDPFDRTLQFLYYLRRTKLAFKDLPIEEVHKLTSNIDTTAIDSGLDLQRLLSGIPSKARGAIQHVKLDGLSVSEAAIRSGMSESSVKVAVHRGLKALALRIRAQKRT
jgi:RNA polymerase sigma-70 factor, ECF subfamily